MAAWRAILEGPRAATARAHLAALTERLLQPPRLRAAGEPAPAALLGGLPGLAIALAALGEEHADRAVEHLETSVAATAELGGEGGLARGIAGLAFALELLDGGGDGDEEDPNRSVDEALADEVAADPTIPAELMRGLAGRAVYARERLARPTGRALHAAIVERLIASAEPGPGGWRSAPDPRYADPGLIARHPGGWFDLGVAHGAPAVIATLCRGGARAADSARDGMAWLWEQRAAPAFPAIAGEEPRSEPGWCYGDDGIGAVLLVAARELGDAGWQARWLEVLRGAARRAAPADSLGLCHGAAGLGHIYNRVHQATGEAWALDAACARFDQLFARIEAEADRLPSGLLDGLSGIALTIAAALGGDEPAWDRALLLS